MDARTQHGHTTFVQTSVQSAKAFRRSGAVPPEISTISQPPKSVSLKPHHLYGKLAYGERTRLILVYIAILVYVAILSRWVS